MKKMIPKKRISNEKERSNVKSKHPKQKLTQPKQKLVNRQTMIPMILRMLMMTKMSTITRIVVLLPLALPLLVLLPLTLFFLVFLPLALPFLVLLVSSVLYFLVFLPLVLLPLVPLLSVPPPQSFEAWPFFTSFLFFSLFSFVSFFLFLLCQIWWCLPPRFQQPFPPFYSPFLLSNASFQNYFATIRKRSCSSTFHQLFSNIQEMIVT